MPYGNFGNYKVNFSKVTDVTFGEVYGKDDITPAEMNKIIWKFIKQKGLDKK